MIEADPSPVPQHVVVQLAVGFKAFIGGRAMHVVDPLLTDPLLARLPVYEPEAGCQDTDAGVSPSAIWRAAPPERTVSNTPRCAATTNDCDS
jgi:hypothetical protein